MKKLLNPIAHFNEYVLLAVGAASVALNVISGYFLHFKMNSLLKFIRVEAGFGEVAWAAFVAYGTGIVSLYLYGLLINRKTRLLDIVNTVLLAMIPPLGMVYLIRIPVFDRIQALLKTQPDNLPVLDTFLLMLLAMTALGLLVYFSVLIYRGFKTSTNLKTPVQVVLFVFILFLVSTFSSYLLKL